MSEVNYDALTILRAVPEKPQDISLPDLLELVYKARCRRHPLVRRCGLGFMLRAKPVIVERMINRFEERHRIDSTIEEESIVTRRGTHKALVPHFSRHPKDLPHIG